jgi:hypothetical protein
VISAQKKEGMTQKGIGFEKKILEQPDLYTENKFSRTRSAVVNYRFGALFQK